MRYEVDMKETRSELLRIKIDNKHKEEEIALLEKKLSHVLDIFHTKGISVDFTTIASYGVFNPLDR